MLLHLGLLLAFVLWSVHASAQEPSPEDLSDPDVLANMSLEDLLNVQVEVSSKRLQRANEAPSSVTVITRRDMLRMGVTTVEEALNYVAGYHVASDVFSGSVARVYVRGLRSAFNANILFLLDGRPLNDLFYGTSSVFNRQMPIENVDRIEVIRGPGSALYGANAFTGVVNIVTAKEGTAVSALAGTPGRRQIAARVNEEIGDLKLSGFARAFGDEGYQFGSVTDSFGQTHRMRDPQSGYDLRFSAAYKGLSLTVRDVERSVEGWLGFGGYSPINRGTFKQTTSDLDYTHQFLDKRLTTNVGVAYTREEQETLGLLFPVGYEVIPRITTLERAAYGGPIGVTHGIRGYLGLHWQMLKWNMVTLGATFDHIFIERLAQYQSHDAENLWREFSNVRRLTGERSWADPGATRQVLGVFVQDQVELFDALSLTAGVRYDWYNDLDSAVSPRAALIYKTPFHSHLKLLYGHAFRAPNLAELHQRNNPLIIGEPNLRSESIDTYEVGYLQNLPRLFDALALSSELTLFHNDVDSLILLGQPLGSGVRPYANQRSVKTTGIEAELKASLADLTLLANATHLFSVKEGGEEVASEAPRNMFSGVINYVLGSVNLNLSAIFRDKSETFAPQSRYVLLNSAVSWSPIEKVTLIGSVQNIADVRYMGVSEAVLAGVPQRGRTFYVGVRYE